MHRNVILHKISSKQRALILLFLLVGITIGLASTSYSGFATTENNTLMQPQGTQSMSNTSNSTNVVLVHGGWADGSGWNKQIPILREAGHKVIAVQLPTQSLTEDVETVKRAIRHIGGPVTLVGHSYGGAVITNAAYNNRNYIAAFAPDEGQSLGNFVDPSTLPKDLLVIDSGGFAYINSSM